MLKIYLNLSASWWQPKNNTSNFAEIPFGPDKNLNVIPQFTFQSALDPLKKSYLSNHHTFGTKMKLDYFKR